MQSAVRTAAGPVRLALMGPSRWVTHGHSGAVPVDIDDRRLGSVSLIVGTVLTLSGADCISRWGVRCGACNPAGCGATPFDIAATHDYSRWLQLARIASHASHARTGHVVSINGLLRANWGLPNQRTVGHRTFRLAPVRAETVM